MDNELNISISDFLNTEYKDYSLYTIESRAIPSCIDSLKTVQRKILHVSSNIWKTGAEKFLKVFQLSGAVASDCLHYDTEILLSNGETIKIGDWFHNFIDLKLEVLCLDENGDIVKSIGFNPKLSLQKEIYEIETEDCRIHKLSGNHLVMLDNLTYKKVSELTIEDNIKSIL